MNVDRQEVIQKLTKTRDGRELLQSTQDAGLSPDVMAALAGLSLSRKQDPIEVVEALVMEAAEQEWLLEQGRNYAN